MDCVHHGNSQYFFDFDREMEIINKLYVAGYTVVAMVNDMDPTNQKLWRNLGVSYGKYLWLFISASN